MFSLINHIILSKSIITIYLEITIPSTPNLSLSKELFKSEQKQITFYYNSLNLVISIIKVNFTEISFLLHESEIAYEVDLVDFNH